MKRLMLTTAVLGLVALATQTADARPWFFRRQAAQPMPAPVATTRVENGYRAFTYQPTVNVVPARVRTTGNLNRAAFRDATAKVLGNY